MRRAVKEAWVSALRSGEYRQGYKRLKTITSEETKFCCLGVLCDLASKEGLGQWNGDTFYSTDNQISISELPWDVIYWAGLPMTADPVVKGPLGTFQRLTHLNDHSLFNFHQIADAIEAHFKI